MRIEMNTSELFIQLNDFKELNDSNGQLLLNFQNVKFLVDTNESSLKTIRTIIIF